MAASQTANDDAKQQISGKLCQSVHITTCASSARNILPHKNHEGETTVKKSSPNMFCSTNKKSHDFTSKRNDCKKELYTVCKQK